MVIQAIERQRSELEHRVLEFLRGTVFHVTRSASLNRIFRTGAIQNNSRGEFAFSYPQSKQCFGRCYGYVCLFDFRKLSLDDIDNVLRKFYFVDPFHEGRVAFLFVDPSYHEELIPWTAAQNSRKMFIPYAECWHDGDLSLDKIERIIEVVVLD